ncbi:ATP-binding protein [Roseobacter sp. HKCCA0434]|uniref:sensor histidine kinase n=1 Tax=Roseobacter sp. HKCCA0434 TaxID=3079297 RepID=UPI002905E446|nr:ATP-binding protein [Roseobacter sp. HKCCA0434]
MTFTRPDLRAVLIGLVLLVTAFAVWHGTRLLTRDAALEAAAQRAELYRASLIAALEQFDHLPPVLSEDPLLTRALSDPAARPAANARLTRFAAEAGLDALYLMDRSGLTIAASNAGTPGSFEGQNYGFRPYFIEALAGGRGAYFAIGATTNAPGFFLSAPIGADPLPLGVVALKRDLTDLTEAWIAGGEQVFVSDESGVIVLSALPELTYRTLRPLGPRDRDRLAFARQFGTEPLTPLDDFTGGATTRLSGQEMLHVTRPVGRLGWQLHYFTPRARVLARANTALGLFALAALSGFALWLILRGRRVRRALGISQEARRALSRANAALAAEIEERREAQLALAAAQADLERSSRLAALGQLSASVTHELGQPIAAMRTWLGAADMPGSGHDPDTRALLDRLGAITDRMQGIVRQLRHFAQPQKPDLRPVDLRLVATRAAEVAAPGTPEAITLDLPDAPVLSRADAARLEQVLINLLRNAREASAGHTDRPVTLRIETTDVSALLQVRDHGRGLDQPDRVFEPFFTTKPSGGGMGLGLAISATIMAEHGGTLRAEAAEGGGTRFIASLPLIAGTARA